MTSPDLLPDSPPLSATRAELLARQAQEAPAALKRAFSVRALLPGLLWVVVGGLSGSTLAPALRDSVSTPLRAVWGVVTVALVGVAVWGLLRFRARSRARREELWAWIEADRTPAARTLPNGEIEPGLMTSFDARDRPDLLDVAGDARLKMQSYVYGPGLLGPGFALIPVWFVGLLLWIGVLPGDVSTPSRCGLLLSGLLVIGPSTLAFATIFRESYRRQQRFNRQAVEDQILVARRTAQGDPAVATPVLPRWVRPVVSVIVGVPLLALLVYRIMNTTWLVILLVVALFAVGGAIAGVAVLRQRYMRTIPLLAPGSSLHEAPTKAVALVAADDGLHVTPAQGMSAPPVVLRWDDLVVIEPVELGYPFAPPALAFVTSDDALVVAAPQIEAEPAVVEARRRLGEPATA